MNGGRSVGGYWNLIKMMAYLTSFIAVLERLTKILITCHFYAQKDYNKTASFFFTIQIFLIIFISQNYM